MTETIKNILKKIEKHNSQILTIYIAINVLWIFLGIFFCNYFKWYSYHEYSTAYIFIAVLNIITITYINIRKKSKIDKIDIFLILLVVFGIIATLFAQNPSISLYGYWRRYEGFGQLVYYYTLMYLSTNIKNDKHKKIIITSILFFGIINVFASIIQAFNILNFIPIKYRGTKFAMGYVGHANFFGSYMTLCLGISMGLFLYNKEKKIKTILKLILCMLFYTGMLLSNALSAIVGLIGMILSIIIYFIYLIKKKQVEKKLFIRHIILLTSLVLVNIILTCSNKTILNDDVKKLTNEVTEVSKGNLDDSYGTSRMFIWKNTMKVVPKYLLHGVGIDSFPYAFGEHTIYIMHSEKNMEYFDKAHNEYLQKLICEGIFSCITYIGMLFTIFITSVKNIIKKQNYITMSLLLALIGYGIQAFFNISVIEVAPLFWIIIGLLYRRK